MKKKKFICPNCHTEFTEEQMITQLIKEEDLSVTKLAERLNWSRATAFRKLKASGFVFKRGWFKERE